MPAIAHRDQRLQPRSPASLYSALHLFTRLAIQPSIPSRRARLARSSPASKPPQQGNRTKRPVAFLSTMSNSRSHGITSAGQMTSPDPSRSSQHGTFSLTAAIIAGAAHSAPIRRSIAAAPHLGAHAHQLVGSGGADDVRLSALVEPTGIEPATSCLQSRRSPS